MTLPCERTPYGFRWGVTEVSRACEDQGTVVLQIETPRQLLDIYVTPTGLIRVGGIQPSRKPKECTP